MSNSNKTKSGCRNIIPPNPPELSEGLIWVRKPQTKPTVEQLNRHATEADLRAWTLTGPAHGWLPYDKWSEMMSGMGWMMSWQAHSIMLDIYEQMYLKLEKEVNQSMISKKEVDS